MAYKDHMDGYVVYIHVFQTGLMWYKYDSADSTHTAKNHVIYIHVFLLMCLTYSIAVLYDEQSEVSTQDVALNMLCRV